MEKEKNLGGRPRVLQDRQLISLNVESKKKQELDRLAQKIDSTAADLLREGLDMVLAKYRK